MTKRVKAKKKISRSLGVSLWGRANDPFLKRNYRPGQHGTAPKRETNHSIHLRAKQKVRKYYDIRESQFRKIFDEAKRLKGNTEEVFAGLLESRLASIVYRANFVPTVYAARQLVSHKHVLVNGKPINIPSYKVKVGDVISIVEGAKKMPLINESLESMERDIPSYLELNASEKTVKFLNKPSLDNIPYPFEVEFNMIVEFYSK
ncbi:MAG TPA: 30S ribosomal protein S4 [Rickettsiales bacterium]|nr:30S ribosomal protein S4 [Rickettsiales bacterium]